MTGTQHANSIWNQDQNQNRTDRLQQALQVAEFSIAHLRLHLDFTDNPLKPLKSRWDWSNSKKVVR